MSARKSTTRRGDVPTPPVRFGAEQDDDLPRGVVRSTAAKAATAAGQTAGAIGRQVSKKTRKAAKRTFTGLLISFALRVAVFYTLFAAVWNCPSRPFSFDYSHNDSRALCRTLAQTRDHVQPLVEPYVHKLQDKVEPYVRPLRPYVQAAYRHAKPVALHAHKTGTKLYKKHVLPVQRSAIKRGRELADPHVAKVQEKYAAHVQPHILTAQRTVQPYQDIYWRDVHPHVQTSYQMTARSAAVSSTFYLESVHPQLMKLARALYRFHVEHLSPALQRFYALYIAPQVDKLLGKVWKHRATRTTDEAISHARAQVDAVGAGAAYESEKAAKVEQAVKKAEQVRDEPGVVDRLAQATDAIRGKEQPDDTVAAAARTARVEAEAAVLTEKLELWETGLGELIRKEFKLYTERVADMRTRAMAELPQQVALLAESFVDEEAGVVLSRLERGFKRLAPERDSRSLEERLDAVQQLVAKETARLGPSAGASSKLRNGLADLAQKLAEREVAAAHESADEIDRYVDAAVKSFEETMSKVAHQENKDEWEGWDSGLKVRANMYREELLAVQSGDRPVKAGLGTNLRKEANVASAIEHLSERSAALYTETSKELQVYIDSAVAQLRGEGRRQSFDDVSESISNAASDFSADALAAMRPAVAAARRKLGLSDETEPTPVRAAVRSATSAAAADASSASSGIAESARSVAAAASQAAGDAAERVQDAAEGIFHAGTTSVSQNLQNAVETASAEAEGAFNAATTSVEQPAGALRPAATDAASAVKDAFEAATTSVEQPANAIRNAASAVSASAESIFHAGTTSVEQPVDAVRSAATAASSSAEGAFNAATTSVSQATDAVRNYAAVATDAAGDAFEAATSSVAGAAEAAATVAADATDRVKDAFNAAITSVEQGNNIVDDPYGSASSVVAGATDKVKDALNAATTSVEQGNNIVNDPYGTASSAFEQATASAASAFAAGSDAAASAAGAVSSSASFAAGAAGESAASVASDASAAAHAATRSVISAAGGTPSPEGFVEHVSSAAAAASGKARHVIDEL